MRGERKAALPLGAVHPRLRLLFGILLLGAVCWLRLRPQPPAAGKGVWEMTSAELRSDFPLGSLFGVKEHHPLSFVLETAHDFPAATLSQDWFYFRLRPHSHEARLIFRVGPLPQKDEPRLFPFFRSQLSEQFKPVQAFTVSSSPKGIFLSFELSYNQARHGGYVEFAADWPASPDAAFDLIHTLLPRYTGHLAVDTLFEPFPAVSIRRNGLTKPKRLIVVLARMRPQENPATRLAERILATVLGRAQSFADLLGNAELWIIPAVSIETAEAGKARFASNGEDPGSGADLARRARSEGAFPPIVRLLHRLRDIAPISRLLLLGSERELSLPAATGSRQLLSRLGFPPLPPRRDRALAYLRRAAGARQSAHLQLPHTLGLRTQTKAQTTTLRSFSLLPWEQLAAKVLNALL